MYWHAPDAARAVEDAGLRGVICSPLIDQGDASGLGALKDDALASLDSVEAFGDRITPFLGPHAVYTVSPPSLEWIGETVADARYRRAHPPGRDATRGRRLCHRARSATRRADRPLRSARTRSRSWRTVAGSNPTSSRSIADRGATVVTNPVSNMKLAVGRQFPYREAVQAGVRDRARYRRRGLEQQPRPVPGHEGAGVGAEVRQRRSRRPCRRAEVLGHRDGSALGAARRAIRSRSVRRPTC